MAAGTIARAAIEAGLKAVTEQLRRAARDRPRGMPVSGVPAVTVGRQETGSVRRVVRCALDDFRSGPLFLTCNALGQTAVMPGHLVEYNSSIAGEE